MNPRFRHVALIGKYHGANAGSSRVRRLRKLPISWRPRAARWPWSAIPPSQQRHAHYPALDVEAIGAQCDLALVVGGDGTMLGIGRQLARMACR
jgi:NAD+ kinase